MQLTACSWLQGGLDPDNLPLLLKYEDRLGFLVPAKLYVLFRSITVSLASAELNSPVPAGLTVPMDQRWAVRR